MVRGSLPSFHHGHLPAQDDVDRFRRLSDPHVQSFNYFWDVGLRRGIADLPYAEIDILDPKRVPSPEENVDLNSLFDDVPTVRFWVENVTIKKPLRPGGGRSASKTPAGFNNSRLCPRECRELGLMYSGDIEGDFCFQRVSKRNSTPIPGRIQRIPKNFGKMPIMVLSKGCHLRNKSPAELVMMKEEQTEFGGYFIVNGIERVVRLLQVPRRNHATAIQRSSYKNRGSTYTDLGVAMRCSRYCGDQSSITNTLHYLTTGGATLKFIARKQEFLVPIVLIARALSARRPQNPTKGGQDTEENNEEEDYSDEELDEYERRDQICLTDGELYRRVVQGDDANTFLKTRVELLLQDARSRFPDLNTADECLEYIGARFRNLSQRANSTSNIDVGHFMLQRFVMIHLNRYEDKLECLLYMLRKLYSFAAGDCSVDNADSLQNQEILLPGHLLSTFVKEKFDETLQAIRLGIIREMKLDFKKLSTQMGNVKYWSKLVDRNSGKTAAGGGIGAKVQHFLSTGNIISTTGLDLMQVSGYTIVAERLNFLRYCSHFRSVHRGQFFMEMKTTAVRKLLPDQWGFLCPVHTPDGGPCGLLSHLSLNCEVMSYPAKNAEFPGLKRLLLSLGVKPAGIGGDRRDGRLLPSHNYLPVCLDGKVIGGATSKDCKLIATTLRRLKVQSKPKVPPTLEVALIPPSIGSGPSPGLFLFTGAARLIRPVLQRVTGRKEYIGPMEQPFMDIACLDEDVREGITTHQELDPNNMLSLIASLTPFSDYNQSPRNMYQCQMGKQTMGTPVHSLPYRTDNKIYKLQNPQAPLVSTKRHRQYKMDEYPNGTNAIVAVLSYTGFDMEDAMILNQGSFNRGFGHASVYKTIRVNLEEEAKLAGFGEQGTKNRMRFSNAYNHRGEALHRRLGADGLPDVGQCLSYGEPMYCVVDEGSGKDRVVRHKERELARVQCVRALGSQSGKAAQNEARITLRFNRNPVIGDKFSSRHGQKGVLSIVWPQENMPFSESGITPDVIINPHAFPSRMTIGMLIESIAGKAGAAHGELQDATPFSFHETGDKLAVDYFGEQLQKAGYNYYGSEPLYSGASGCLMEADLYIGVVYYQRLRHMVSDKYQVRANGPVNQLTRQPIKGRKKGGGIRLGEMERDSLLSHGAAFILHDRLLNSSDKSVVYACRRCGDLLSPTTEMISARPSKGLPDPFNGKRWRRLYCRNPQCVDLHPYDVNDEAVEPIALPYVFRYLAVEFAAMNMKMRLEIE